MSRASTGPGCTELLRCVRRLMQEFEKRWMWFVRTVEKATESGRSLQEGDGPPAYVVGGEAVLAHHNRAWGRCAKAVHATNALSCFNSPASLIVLALRPPFPAGLEKYSFHTLLWRRNQSS